MLDFITHVIGVVFAICFIGCCVGLVVVARRKKITNVPDYEARVIALQQDLAVAKADLKSIEQNWKVAYDRFTAIDIETTGLSRAKSKIIQIAIVNFVGGRVSTTWSTYLNPGIRIPDNATKVNNITDDMVSSAPLFVDISDDIRLKLDVNPLVAHNLQYDTDILIAEFSRHNILWNPNYGHCTMTKAWGAPIPEPPREERTFYSKRERRHVTYKVRPQRKPWLKLTVAMERHGIRPIGALHDARTDAVGCSEVFVARALEAITISKNRVLLAEEYLKSAEQLRDKTHK